MKPLSIAPLVLALAAAAPFAAGAETLQGVVRYTGPELAPRMLRMDADPKCAELHGGNRVADRNLRVGEDGALADAFVWLKSPPAGTGPFTAPTEAKRLVQHGCFYEPRVLGIMVEQTLEVVNDDPTLHNVRSLARANRPINLGQPMGSPPRTKFFTKPEEAVKFKCDVHPWMASYVFVLDHPFYATTGADGTFSIPDLPAGKHTLSVWHETLGTQDVEVEVPIAGAPVEVIFEAPPSDE
ncbi:MAG TPA: hypothetical protein VMV46_13425 [Thermoanaerobaculia bacterium]|nr:hypothetical protein [Thermoanaerobaculia bacterium]